MVYLLKYLLVQRMSKTDFWSKRIFDIFFSSIGIAIFWPLIILCWIVAAVDTRSNGFFIHERVGRHGCIINVYKIKTMYASDGLRSPIASNNISSMTKSGFFFRKYKLDELPQLFNVLSGSMSIVGPRPDVPGYADQLEGSDRLILLLRPGITGPASIKYKNEEALLSAADDAVLYNDTIIWPDKVRINKQYFMDYSLLSDIKYIMQTFFQ
jgi:lipopolysaccharide/colanic/teichoic acid biosynthesis glycosyltransferase